MQYRFADRAGPFEQDANAHDIAYREGIGDGQGLPAIDDDRQEMIILCTYYMLPVVEIAAEGAQVVVFP